MAPKKSNYFENFANWATNATGSSAAFITAIVIILIWIVTGPVFHYSDTWQLIINTGTTIVTFLMVFLIQKSQNKLTSKFWARGIFLMSLSKPISLASERKMNLFLSKVNDSGKGKYFLT